jgi:hypothetical protein
MKYAQDTSVSSDRSQAEIKTTLQRYGASKYAYFEEDERSAIVFELNDRRLRFVLPLPSRMADEFVYRYYGGKKTSDVLPVHKQHTKWEQACRQRWRALALAVKAKLEAVESGITTLEEEFLAHIVLADGKTIGEHITPQIPQLCSVGGLPKLLPAMGETDQKVVKGKFGS